MTITRSALALTLLSFPLCEYLGKPLEAIGFDCIGTWTGAGTPNTDWNTSGNWSGGCVPGHVPLSPNIDSATFDGTGATFTSNISATAAVTINHLTFTTTLYTITGSAGQVLQFNGTSPNLPLITNSGSGNTINLPVVFLANGTITGGSGVGLEFFPLSSVTSLSGVSLTLNGPIFSNSATSPGFSPQILNIASGVTNNGLMAQSLTSLENLVVTLSAGGNLNNTATFLNSTTGSTATFNMTGGTLNNQSEFGQSSSGTTSINISGGTVTNSSLFGSAGATAITLSGGTIANNTNGLFGIGAASVTVSGATITNAANLADGTTLSMSSGTINNNSGGNIGSSSNGSTLITMTGTGTLTNASGGNIYSKGISISGGTLSNAGTVTMVSNQGSPTTGTLGTFQQLGGTVVVDLLSPTSFGAINANNATLNGTLTLNALPGFSVPSGQTITILTADSSLSGTFSPVQDVGFPSGTTVEVLYNTTVAPFTVSLLFQIPTPPAPVATLTSYVGGGITQSIFSSVNHINVFLTGKMANARSRFGSQTPIRKTASMHSSSDELTASADDGIVAINPQTRQKQEILKRGLNVPEEKRWNVYAGPLGTIGEVHALRSNQAGFHFWSAGALTGFDYAFEQLGIGLLANYQRLEANVKHNWGRFTIDEVHADIYATYAPKVLPELAFNGIVGGSYDWTFIRRKTGTSTDKEIAKGTPHIQEFDALFGVEYTFGKRQFPEMTNYQVIPLASVQYIYLHTDHYKEHNAGMFNLAIKAQRAKSLRSILGARFNYNYQSQNFSFFPEINVAWQREYLDHHRSVKSTPINVAAATSSSLGIIGAGRNFALAGIDLLFTFYKNYGIEANYEYEWNTIIQDHFAYVGFNVRF